jgi:hypothetical protein
MAAKYVKFSTDALDRMQRGVDNLANSGKVTFGSQGNGATPHLTGMMFQGLTGTRMVHVPYRGETLVLQDMIGGHVDVFFGNVAGARPHFRDGKVKVVAVLDGKRAPTMPEAPEQPPRECRLHQGRFAALGREHQEQQYRRGLAFFERCDSGRATA